EEGLQPGALDHVVDGTAIEMRLPWLRARLVRVAMRRPAAHHPEGHIWMELQAKGIAPSKRLVRKIIASREQLRATRQLKTLAVPMVDLCRPVRAEREPGRSRANRVVTDLGQALRMRRDPGPELLRQHLGAETDAEKRPLLPERDFDPVDLTANIVVGIV